jgi:glycosyltransferase involved in cell wall biosynthesis
MRKFILIDQSIKDAGGHHLEYALRVLRAAKKMGFSSVLATNRLCNEIKSEHIDIVDRAFTYTFWENYQSESIRFGVKERHLLSTIKIAIAQVLYALMCSPFGFAYIAASQGLDLPDMFLRYGTATSGKKLSAISIVIGYFLVRVTRVGKKLFNWILHFPFITRKMKRIFFLTPIVLFGFVLLPIILPYFLLRWSRFFGRADTYASKFTDDLQRMLIRIDAANGDIVFIPTLGNVELFGAGVCIENFPVEHITWHFLFRRNIFQGREPMYQGQIEDQLRTLQSFSAFKQRTPTNVIKLYTDTEALTEQYNRLAVFNFKTLPIPLDETLKRSNVARDQLNVLYIGDARDEKGFPLLSRLVADLHAAGYSKKNIRFVFQSNFNVPGGEYGSRIGFAELSMESAEWVSLVDGPFESAQYTSLINSADLILVPYDCDSYYARSSGVFAEALAAGIPVVSSNKSWMSQELLHLNQEYYRMLLETESILQSIPFVDLEQGSELQIQPHAPNECVWLIIEIKQLFEKPGQFIDIIWESSPFHIFKVDRAESFYHHFTIDLRSSKAFGLLRLPAKDRLLLRFEFDNGSGERQSITKSGADALSVVVHELNLPADTPLFQVAGLYCRDEDLSSAAIEVIEHYEQYLTHSNKYKHKWAGFHNSENLVKILDEGVK